MSRFSHLEFGGTTGPRPSSNATPAKDEAHYLAEARRWLERGEFEPSLRLYARALEENPRSAAAWAGQTRMLIELGQLREANAWADKALEVHPGDPEILSAKAMALGRSGEWEAALAFSDAAIGEQTVSPYAWLARADVLLGRGDRQVDYCLDKAITLAARDWLVTWLAARVRMFHHQFAGALKLLQQAVALDAGRFVVWLQMAECEVALGYLDAARTSFRQALDLEPDNGVAQEGLRGLTRPTWGRRMQGFWRRLRGS